MKYETVYVIVHHTGEILDSYKDLDGPDGARAVARVVPDATIAEYQFKRKIPRNVSK